MFASVTRRLFAATLFIVCAFLAACSTTPESNTNTGQPNSQPANAEAPTTIADGRQTTGERYEGFLDQADCNTVSGWAWNKNKPNGVEYVEILADNVPIATPPASGARWSVAKYTGDNGYHGFVYTVQPSLKDGKPHIIRARISQTNFELQNSPKTMTCTSP